jgi:serine/threonine protein kinase
MDNDVVMTEELQLGLPRKSLAQARGRIQLVAGAFGIGGFGIIVAYGIAGYFLARSTFLPDSVSWGAYVILLVACYALWVMARSPRYGDTFVLYAALVVEVLACLVLSLSTYHFYIDRGSLIPHVTWVIPIIIMYPLIIPIPKKPAFWAALASGLTVPVSILYCELTVGSFHSPFTEYFIAVLSVAGAVAIAVFGSEAANKTMVEAAGTSPYIIDKNSRMEGGMGAVYKARHKLLDAEVAIKQIRADRLAAMGDKERREAIERMKNEATKVAKLQCPHTIDIFDTNVDQHGEPYLVMEFLHGKSLNQILRPGECPLERIVYVLLQVCESLAEAHDKSIIHRDIKHSNIMVCRYGRDVDFVKVVDFGIAKDLRIGEDTVIGSRTGNGGGARTGDREMLGSPSFISPEQVRGLDSDARTDIYSLGCVLYHLVTGKVPFSGKTTLDLMTKRVCECTLPTPPAEINSGVPRELSDLIMACLHVDPDHRPVSMDALADGLRAGMNGRTWTQRESLAWWDEHDPLKEKAQRDAEAGEASLKASEGNADAAVTAGSKDA